MLAGALYDPAGIRDSLPRTWPKHVRSLAAYPATKES